MPLGGIEGHALVGKCDLRAATFRTMGAVSFDRVILDYDGLQPGVG